jgi:hypothetical protein
LRGIRFFWCQEALRFARAGEADSARGITTEFQAGETFGT